MEQQSTSREVRTPRIARVLSVLGIVLIAFGILIGIVIPLAITPAWETMSAMDDPRRFEIFIRSPWIVFVHVAAGTICMGVSKAIRILEEIRAGR